jgi:hypothetical protein
LIGATVKNILEEFLALPELKLLPSKVHAHSIHNLDLADD